jgi:glycosyltransferase involved in cell wall biosynthesis
MKYSIIINCYNTLPLIQSCLEAALKTTDQKTELILINNHPPYQKALDYLASLDHPRVLVLDPGKNIGCMPGFQLGAEHATGEYLIKLDDDVIVPLNNWLQAMHNALKGDPALAYVALQPAALKPNKAQLVAKNGYSLEYHQDTILFWCMMINRKLWKSQYVMNNLPLYGVGESYYAQKTRQLGLKKAYLVSHVCTSLGRTKEADPLYGAWKLFYVKLKNQRVAFPEWQRQFKIGQEEVRMMQDFGYPDDQIETIQKRLNSLQVNGDHRSEEPSSV